MDIVGFDCYLIQQVDFGSGGHQLSFVALSTQLISGPNVC